MSRLSQYTTGYDSDEKEDMPWDFWTDEERSWVIFQGYERFMLKSSEVAPYLRSSRINILGNLLFPVVAFAASTAITKRSISVGRSYLPAVGLTAAASLLWWNLSPLYSYKEKKQEELLNTLYLRITNNIILLNDILPRWTLASSYDKRCRRLYWHRNGFLGGLLFPGNDDMRPIRETSKAEKHTRKKIYK